MLNVRFSNHERKAKMHRVANSNEEALNIQPVPKFYILENEKERAPDISVIIVSWNSKAFILECLDSLSVGVDNFYEVIVIDNDSNDGSPELINKIYPWVRLIKARSNLGFAKGNNLGINKSRGKYIALINSDVKVFPGCLDQLEKFMRNNPGVGMVGPRVFYGDGRQQSSCRRFPGIWNNACEAFGFNKIFSRSAFFSGEQMIYFSYDKVCEVEVLSGCFVFARKKAVDEFGLLDENFFMYSEDIDWSHRCWESGWKVMFNPKAEAIHYGGGSSKNQPIRFAVALEKSRLLLWRKHLNKTNVLCLSFLAIVSRCLRIFFAIIIGVSKKSEWDLAVNNIKKNTKCISVILKGQVN